MATIKELLILGSQQLTKASIPQPRDQAASLLAYTLGQERIFLLTHDRDMVAPSLIATYEHYLQRCSQGEPLQYIRGYQEFYGREFYVTPAVLIPRPETEFIIETALNLLANGKLLPTATLMTSSLTNRNLVPPQPATANLQILDLCTGSGCIAITLAAELPQARLVASDISLAALKIAQLNAQRHQVTTQIHWLAADLSSALRPQPLFDLCCANPPYIALADRESLSITVRNYEPATALFAAQAGTALIYRIIQEMTTLVKPHGYLLCEIGYGQEAVIHQQVDLTQWIVHPTVLDLQQIPRVLVLQRRE
jgi:release factor glutamine methyltransferase